MPRVIDQDTGKSFILDHTPELDADLAPLSERCEHSKTELRQRRNRGGAIQYAEQCLTCGRAASMFKKHSADLANAPQWDDDLEQGYISSQKRKRAAIT